MRVRLLVGIALSGVLLQFIGRSQIARASARASGGYALLIFVGIAATAFAAASAVFKWVRRRSGFNLVALLASLVVFAGLGFYGLYLPWIHPAIADVRRPRMAWLDAVVAIVGREPRHEVYELPPGFRGWVVITLENSDCPPLDVRDGVTYFHVGADGTVCTSGREPAGAYVAKYIYVDEPRTELKESAWGAGGMIWGESTAVMDLSGLKISRHYFFVGSEKDFRAGPAHPL